MDYLKKIKMLKLTHYFRVLFTIIFGLLFFITPNHNTQNFTIASSIIIILFLIISIKSAINDLFELKRLEKRYIGMNKEDRLKEEKKETSFETSLLYYKKYSKSYLIKSLSVITIILILTIILVSQHKMFTIEKYELGLLLFMGIISEIPIILCCLKSTNK